MKRRITTFFALLALALPLAVQAQEDIPATERGGRVSTYDAERFAALEERFRGLTELHKQPPKREYKAEMGPAEPTKLFRADPKLLENKFVAGFTVLAARVNPDDQQSVEQHETLRNNERYNLRERLPDELKRLIATPRTFWFHADIDYRSSQRSDLFAANFVEHHRRLLDRCPADERPAERLAEFLTSDEADRDILRNHSAVRRTTRASVPAWRYAVYAPTANEAQNRVEAILQLLDCGMCQPMREYYLEQGRGALESTREGIPRLKELEQEIETEREKLAKPSEITPDILSQLKAQKVMVAVELAGLNARVKACDDMLKEPRRLEVSTLQSVSDMKVKAEIERIGIKEKLDQINTFISEGDNRGATQDRLLKLTSERAQVSQQLSRDHRTAERYAALVELYLPFRLQNDTLTIAPVEWTN